MSRARKILDNVTEPVRLGMAVYYFGERCMLERKAEGAGAYWLVKRRDGSVTKIHGSALRDSQGNAIEPEEKVKRAKHSPEENALYSAAKTAGEQLYGKPGERGTHGSHFSFNRNFVVKTVTREQFLSETGENESYELHTFDPQAKKPLWTNAKPINPKDALPGKGVFTPASDGKIYVADQHWGDDLTVIYVIS